jgi:hypothetical protein
MVAEGPRGTAWDEERRGGWAGAFVETVKGSIVDPIPFFEGVGRGSGWLRPWAFALVVSAIAFLVSAAYQLGFQALATGFDLSGSIGDPLAAAAALSMFPLSVGALAAIAAIGVPVGTTAAILIQAGVYHLCLMALGAARREFAATFRVACYSMGPQVFQLIPLFGGPLAWGWQTVLAVIGLKVVHRTTYSRSAAAVFLPLMLCCGAILLVFAAVAGWAFAALLAAAR